MKETRPPVDMAGSSYLSHQTSAFAPARATRAQRFAHTPPGPWIGMKRQLSPSRRGQVPAGQDAASPGKSLEVGDRLVDQHVVTVAAVVGAKAGGYRLEDHVHDLEFLATDRPATRRESARCIHDQLGGRSNRRSVTVRLECQVEEGALTEEETLRRVTSPGTASAIVDGLRNLGELGGETVLVHSSLSRLGWVAGAQAVVEALLAVVGPSGTVVMASQSGQLSDPARWRNPPVPREWWQTIRDEMPAFDPRSPLGRLYELDALVLLLGVGHEKQHVPPPCGTSRGLRRQGVLPAGLANPRRRGAALGGV